MVKNNLCNMLIYVMQFREKKIQWNNRKFKVNFDGGNNRITSNNTI